MTKRGIRIEKPNLDSEEEIVPPPGKPARLNPFFGLLLALSFLAVFAGLALGLYIIFLE